jgi:glycosyltransferase involved in cell wall biosynthesis
MKEPHILFAPVLKAEGWISIDLQQQNILEALRAEPQPPSLTEIRVPEHGAQVRMIRRFLRDFYYPARIRSEAHAAGSSTLLHVSDHSYGHLCRAHRPSIVNCNDLHHFVTPNLQGLTLWRWKQRAGTMRQADRIITVSENLADEVHRHLDLPRERITALLGGIDTELFRKDVDPATDEAQCPAIAEVRRQYPVILNIGSNIRRKNLLTVLRAMAQLRDDHEIEARLVKIGQPLHGGDQASLIEELHLQQHVIDLGFQTPPQVAAACRLATALSFASLYEGFGRPTLEAQACGLPCVLADASCMREVGGDAALYHRPTDSTDLAAQLKRVITDEAVRGRLIEDGLRNVARFSWSGYAQQLREVYHNVAESAAATPSTASP